LRALDLFYEPSVKADADDFFNKDISEPFSIGLTFSNLSDEAKDLFQKYLQNGTLTVERVFTYTDGKVTAKYHGSSLQNPDFRELRESFDLTDRFAKGKELYGQLKTQTKYAGLPNATAKGDVKAAIEAWEEGNQESCVPARDDGQFFGFQAVGRGNLSKFTRFLFIPAIRDASEDSADGKGTPVSTLMDMVVRSRIATRPEIADFRSETQAKYKELLDPARMPELGQFQDELNATLSVFSPGAEVNLNWQEPKQLQVPLPEADLRLKEDGYASAVSRTGHGLQRAFILTLLQHLAKARSESDSGTEEVQQEVQINAIPNFLIAIEEPELYQHPSRQRYLAKTLEQLASGSIPGVSQVTQILYCTHSPLFVRVDQFENVRILRKEERDPNLPKVAKIYKVTLNEIGAALATIDGAGEPYDGESVKARLSTIMTPWMNEGFFSDAVVLVEGENDRTAVLATATKHGVDLDSKGTTVIPCLGKSNIDRPYLIFTKLGIPVFAVWDGDANLGETAGKCPECGKDLDKKADPKLNRRLMRMLGKAEEDWPNFTDAAAACFHTNLEDTIRSEVGEEIWKTAMEKCMSLTGMSKYSHVKKKTLFYEMLKDEAEAQGQEIQSLNEITQKILKLQT